MMSRLDSNAIRLAQECYLWLLDRTGVTLGMTEFSIYLVAILMSEKISWGGVLAISVVGILCLRNHVRQSRGEHAAINASAESWEASPLRKAFVIFMIPGILASSWTGKSALVFACALFLVWTYLCTVRVRDREPPEKRHSSQVAEQGT